MVTRRSLVMGITTATSVTVAGCLGGSDSPNTNNVDSGVLFDQELTERGQFAFEAVSGQVLTVELGGIEDGRVRVDIRRRPGLDLVHDQTHHEDTTIQETLEEDSEYYVEYIPSMSGSLSITIELSPPE